ncbi:glycosyltransferase family 2 protein [Sulfitobacter dubius]|uniref:glycosyltransferase family 2 protein n=1 Tax=Sulfitobacter dubius TaxID=218673 RepID=UPI0008EB5ADB|nr:glycosyltransferase family 2 protein [Sulfitobacter dubius]SFG30528.1 Glycosyl transferase family 2 [Sulfitobacter dubius]
MRLTLFIGPTEKAAARLRNILQQQKDALLKEGILAPDWNHVRLYAACAAPDAVGLLRHRRGLDSALIGATLRDEFHALIPRDLAETRADHVVLSAAQLGNLLSRPEELTRLRDLLSPYFDDIRIIAHLEEQARLLTAHYSFAVTEGRRHPLTQELALAERGKWWQGALEPAENAPDFGLFPDVHDSPFWLDYQALHTHWAEVFGAESVQFRPLDLPHLLSKDGGREVSVSLDLVPLGPVDPGRTLAPLPAPWLARMRAFNDVLIRYLQAHDLSCPRSTWSQMLQALQIGGAPIKPGSLAPISDHFADDNAALIAQFPALAEALTPDAPEPLWREADPELGFRTTQYLAAFAHRICTTATPLAQKRAEAKMAGQSARKFEAMLSDPAASEADREANAHLLNRVKVNHEMILSSPFRPHNRAAPEGEDQPAPAYTTVAPRELPPGSSGNVIVGCMKNEAPYILEWVAYHRTVGFDNFLIYTNDCTDGTDAVLGRLQEMGILQHRNNNDWKGNSPQQHALNQALKEPLIRDADWIAHIDVDEFVNIRTGNGRLENFFAAAPDATNVAMTWRLFGHNGVPALSEAPVIGQFDHCAPSFCPKPHTAWGFKTMFRNIGAYEKLSCHRPNKLDDARAERVKWVNGAGRDMTRDALRNGWRSSKSNIGYDLLQLNHYALRSADSFLVKRQRGRALHVDRSIGINYWIRMDWNDHRDLSIQRNLPRLHAEMDRLLADEQLRTHHQAGLAWHRAKAEELHQIPEFRDLYRQALNTKLSATERVAYALALDMES